MNTLYLAVLLTAALHNPTSPKKDSTVTQHRLRYDHKALRIPGQSVSIGIVTRTNKGIAAKTKGFQCMLSAAGDGHDLQVSADVYEDTLIHARLLRIDVNDSVAKKSYHYRLNTNGGSISISSRGGDGENGEDGGNGGNGGNIYVRYTPAVAPYLNLIKAAGIPGKGGSGGRGGDGGRGGVGGSGDPSGNNGPDGMSGRSGFDGTAGQQGKVIFTAI